MIKAWCRHALHRIKAGFLDTPKYRYGPHEGVSVPFSHQHRIKRTRFPSEFYHALKNLGRLIVFSFKAIWHLDINRVKCNPVE